MTDRWWRRHRATALTRAPVVTELDEAIRTVARRVIRNTLVLEPPEWQDYPEVGEYDFEAVVDQVLEVAERLDPDEQRYQAAYELLAARAREAEE